MAEGRPDAQEVRLKDGEWAHIVLADQIKRDKLWIRRGTYARRSEVPDSGVEVEIDIHMNAGRSFGGSVQTIHITRDAARAIHATVVNVRKQE